MRQSKSNVPKIPWKSLQSLVWLVGIGILFLSNDWLPGILVVIAASLLLAWIQKHLTQTS